MKTGIPMAAAGWQRQSTTLREREKNKVRQMKLIRINIFFICYGMGATTTDIPIIHNQFLLPTTFFSPEILVRVTA